MSEVKTSWKFPLLAVNETKRTVRPAVPQGMAWELIGVDGSEEGTLRPAPGFKHVHTLTGNLGTVPQETAGGSQVTFRASSSQYAYGWVYRVKEQASNTCKVFLEYRIGSDLTWNGPVDLVGEKDYGDKQLNVVVVGRFVYVFVEGNEPFLFYLNETSPGTFELVIQEDTGPGKSPEVFAQAAQFAAIATDLTDVLADMAPPTEASARARFLMFFFGNYGSGFASERPTQGASSGASLAGPSDLDLWATPPQNDPVFSTSGSVHYFKTVRLEDDDIAPILLAQPNTLNAAAYAFAYVLYDSRTGRRTQPSDIATISHRSRESSAVFWPGGGWEIGFPAIDLIYDPAKYDTLLLYRSMGVQASFNGLNPVPPENNAFLLKLDSVVTLETYQTDDQPDPSGGVDWARAVYFMHLYDSELPLQDNLNQDSTFLEDMPTGGSSIFYENTMLVGKTGHLDPDIGGLGVAQWSNLLQFSVELYSPRDKYLLGLPTEEVERFCKLGPNVLALTKACLYLVRKETIFLKFFPIHEGFGVTGDRAATTVGSDVYYMSEEGLKILDSDATLSDVNSLNNLVQQWRGELADIQIEFDPTAKVLFILNPTRRQMALLWMQTGKVTEMADAPFTHAWRGDVPYNVDTEGSPLQKRAMFVQGLDQYGDDSGWCWRVFVWDYARQKTNPLTLDPSGPILLTTTQALNSGNQLTITAAGWGGRLEGCKLYVLDGPLAGQSATISRRVSSSVLEFEDDVSNLYGLASGVRVGLSPVYFRWVGHTLPVQASEEQGGVQFAEAHDWFYTRHVDSLGCVFADVSFPDVVSEDEDNHDPRFEALMYRGNETEPRASAFPTGEEDQKVTSIENGLTTYFAAFTDPGEDSAGGLEGRYGVASHALFPGVAIYVPGLDFRLLSVVVTGTIRDSQAAGRLRA